MNRRLLVGYFVDEADILHAAKAAREGGYEIRDVYTPYAVHGLDAAVGQKPSRLPWICLSLGLLGAIAKLWFQIWTSATNWPVNVGGKPYVSFPAFVPVTFEIMVLFAGIGTVITFIIISRLRPGKKPMVKYDRVTNDRFALVLVENDAGFRMENVRALLGQHHVGEIEERIERDNG